MMNTLFVAWQQPTSGEWIPVAKLERRDKYYCFSYTMGVYRAEGFLPFSRMDKLTAVYASPTIFPLFANRLISKSRPEFKDYLRWLGLANMEDDPMAMLALTGGIRGTDSIELFQPPFIGENGEYQVEFFARSLSHLPKEAVSHLSMLSKGDRLYLMRDAQNSFDPNALALRTNNPTFFVGYCPKYYTRDLGALLESSASQLTVTVKCVNLDAPLNMRLLCTLQAKAPLGFAPLDSAEDFEPFVERNLTEWDDLATNFSEALPS